MLQEMVPVNLDVFSSNPIVLAMSSFEDLQLSPVNSLDSSNTIEFFCNGFPEKMKMLNEIYITATMQLLKSDGSKYGKDDDPHGYLTNGILSSLFRSCNLYLNNTLVVGVNENYGIKDFIETSLNFSKSAVSTKLSNQGFYADDDLDSLKNRVKGSKTIELMTKINMINCDKLLLPNVSIGIKLGMNSPDFFINEMSKTASDGSITKSSSKLLISEMKIYIRHVTIREPYLIELETKLMQGYLACYEFQHASCISQTIAPGQSSVSVLNMLCGLKPSLLLLTFLKNSQYVGHRDENSLIFSHNNLKSVSFTIDSESCPKIPFELVSNDDEEKYARLFHALHSSLGVANENISSLVNRSNFLTNYFYVLQDISSFGLALSGLSQELKLSTIGFKATFHEALKTSLTAILYVIVPRKIEINSSKTVNIVY